MRFETHVEIGSHARKLNEGLYTVQSENRNELTLGYETIQLHRFQAATECFAETSDSVCIPPHSEVMLWAKQKTNNGRKGPTAGVVLALQTFVQEFGLLVGRSLVRADADDWKIPILIYNSDPCTMKPANCTCNPVIIPAHTRV